MRERHETGYSRREFLLDCVRGAILGGLAALTGFLSAEKGGKAFHEKCVSGGVCKNCRALDDCSLPKAISMKRSTNGRSS